MKNSGLRLFTLAGIISLLISSCGGTPAPTTQTPPPAPKPTPAAPAPAPAPVPQDPNRGPPDQAALDQLNAAKFQAETSRKQAIDIEGLSYFPPEWQSAEEKYASVKEDARESTLGEVKEAISLYTAVANAYDDLARKSLPLYYQDLEKEIIEAREAAVETGIESLSPERLETADRLIGQAIAKYEEGEPAGNYYEAADYAFQALGRYWAIRPGVQAYYIREEVLKRDFVKYDSDNCALAEASLFEALGAYDTGDIALAQDSANEAFLRYNLALKTGWESYTGEQQASAQRERQAARNKKANVAVRTEYEPAESLFTQGENSFRAEKYPEAAEFYRQSVPLFVRAGIIAEEKRIMAEQAIETAEMRVQVSDETAREAELQIGGGAQ
jgi:hypothetical protein